MLKRIFLLCIVVMTFGRSIHAQGVMLLPALHGLHRTNTSFNYDSLIAVISKAQADVIAVEIRQEDMGEDTSYLRKNYPYEMWMMKFWFPSAHITGFDWLGSDIEGSLIPTNYWQEISRVKKLQRELNNDSSYINTLKECIELNNQRLPYLNDSSLQQILKSRDHELVRSYYDCLDKKLAGSKYEALVDFYNERNQNMMKNLDQVLKDHPGKTIVIITGDDHYPYLLDHLRKLNIVLLYP